MSDAIRFEILGNMGLELVIGEQFAIDGSDEIFAINKATFHERTNLGFEWSATHVLTGLRIAKGNDIDEVIAEAKSVWTSKTDDEIAAALDRGAKQRVRAFIAPLAEGDLAHD